MVRRPDRHEPPSRAAWMTDERANRNRLMDPDVAVVILFVAFAFVVPAGIGAVLYATRTRTVRDDTVARDGWSKL
jgi:hypothetical protein